MVNIISNFNRINLIPQKPEKRGFVFFCGLKTNYLSSDTFDVQNYKKPIATNKELFLEQLVSSVDTGECRGAGSEGIVYNLPNSDYVVKIPLKMFARNGLDKEKIIKNLEEVKELTTQDAVNHIVKRYHNGVVIMNDIKGKRMHGSEVPDLALEVLPKGYNKLINQLHNAYQNKMAFDFIGPNLIMNAEDKSITAIDFRPFENREYDFTPMSYIFAAIGYNAPQDKQKEICGRILMGGLAELAPGRNSKMSVLDLDFDLLLSFYQKVSLDYSNNIDDINAQIIELKSLKIKENNDKLVTPFLQYRYDNVKKMVEQSFLSK